jgi:hypothetical protein
MPKEPYRFVQRGPHVFIAGILRDEETWPKRTHDTKRERAEKQ